MSQESLKSTINKNMHGKLLPKEINTSKLTLNIMCNGKKSTKAQPCQNVL